MIVRRQQTAEIVKLFLVFSAEVVNTVDIWCLLRKLGGVRVNVKFKNQRYLNDINVFNQIARTLLSS